MSEENEAVEGLLKAMGRMKFRAAGVLTDAQIHEIAEEASATASDELQTSLTSEQQLVLVRALEIAVEPVANAILHGVDQQHKQFEAGQKSGRRDAWLNAGIAIVSAKIIKAQAHLGKSAHTGSHLGIGSLVSSSD